MIFDNIGSPLAPLLFNLMLTELGRKLESRGHRFCRYADDCNIYVRNEKAGLSVMDSIERFLETRLNLKVNKAKSAVARPSRRQFLGYAIVAGARAILHISLQSRERFKAKVREVFRGARGRSVGYTIEPLSRLLHGWADDFKWAEASTLLKEFDQWIRHRLRCIMLVPMEIRPYSHTQHDTTEAG